MPSWDDPTDGAPDAMAKRDLTPYQKGIVKRYYEHRDTLALQKLGEIVSDLYVETSESKLARTWRAVHKHLLAAGVHKADADWIVAERDLGALAKLVAQLS
jgi:mevalonate kinase